MMNNNNINNKNLPPAGPSSPIRKFDSPIRAAGTPSVNHFQQQQQQPRMIISSNSPASVLRSPILSSAQQQQQQQNHRPISPIANQLLQGNYQNNNQNNNIRMKSPIISSSSNKNNAIPPSSVAASLILKRAALLHSHYAPRSELGRGSFGVVYLCSVTTLGFSRLLASPCMSAASSASTSSSQNSSSLSPAIPTEVVVKTVILPPDDGKMKEMAIQEVSTLMKLRHHNKVVNVLDAWIESGSLFGINNNNNNNNNIRGNGNHHNRLSPISHSRSPSFQQEKPDQVLCIALEYCSGGTLDEFISKNIKGMPGACPASTVVSVATQIFIGLDFMHRQLHLIHRDIKPANIFLRNNNNNNKKNNGTSAASPLDLVLGDFGISRTLESTYAMAQTRTGTPFWLAPEIPTDQSYSFPVDVWAVGVIMYEMMLGSRPFILSSSSSSPTPAGVPNNNRHPNNNNHHHHHPLALLNRIVNHDPMPNLVQVCAKFYPVELLDLVRGCLEKEPSRRPSANVALEILSGICSKYGYPDEVQNNNNNYFKNNNNSRPTSPVVAGVVGNNNKQQRSPSPVVLSSAISRNNININNKIISSNSLSPNNNNQGCRAPNVTPAFGSPCFVVSSNEKRSPSLSNNVQNKNEAAAAAGDDEDREDSSIKAMNENNRRNNVAFVAAVNNNNNNNNSPSSSVTPFFRFSSSVASYVDFCIFSSSSSSSPSSEKKTFKSSSARRLHDGVGIPGCIALAVLKTTQYQVHVLQKQKQNNQNEEDSSSSSFSNSKNNISSFKFSFSPMLVRSALSMLCLSDGGTMSYLRNADGDSLGRVCVWANEVFI